MLEVNWPAVISSQASRLTWPRRSIDRLGVIGPPGGVRGGLRLGLLIEAQRFEGALGGCDVPFAAACWCQHLVAVELGDDLGPCAAVVSHLRNQRCCRAGRCRHGSAHAHAALGQDSQSRGGPLADLVTFESGNGSQNGQGESTGGCGGVEAEIEDRWRFQQYAILTSVTTLIPETIGRHRRNVQVKPSALRQRVRRFPRNELLVNIARVSSQIAQEDDPFAPNVEGHLAQLAGICVTYCNNHREAPVSREVVEDLLLGFHNVWPDELNRDHDADVWSRVLSRMIYQQGPYQIPAGKSSARSLCLFGNDPRFGEPVLADGRWEAILGVSLEEFLTVGHLMSLVARAFGVISRDTLLSDCFRPIFGSVRSERALRVVDSWFAQPVDELTSRGKEMSPDADDLWRFNPFYEWPIAKMGDDTYVMPSYSGVRQRIGPQGLYFIVRDADPDGFTDFATRLGNRFESYIGSQLESIEHARIHHEIDYNGNRSVDYIIDTPEALILVEVKSAAPDIETRSGVFPKDGEVQRKITKACQQITASVNRIQEEHPLFPRLNGRTMRGMVVTREHYMNLFPSLMPHVAQPVSIPTVIVSSGQLEDVICTLSTDAQCGATLLNAMPSDTADLRTSFKSLPSGSNQLLIEACEPWHDELSGLLEGLEDEVRREPA